MKSKIDESEKENKKYKKKDLTKEEYYEMEICSLKAYMFFSAITIIIVIIVFLSNKWIIAISLPVIYVLSIIGSKIILEKNREKKYYYILKREGILIYILELVLYTLLIVISFTGEEVDVFEIQKESLVMLGGVIGSIILKIIASLMWVNSCKRELK